MPVRIRTVLVALVLLATALTGVGATSASAATWSPPNDVLISNPTGTTAQKHVVQDRMVRLINYTPAHNYIRIASWNIESKRVVDALLRAHHRGVIVRVIMDEANLRSNPQFSRLRKGLMVGNSKRIPAHKSIAKTCVDTCRGAKGAMHAKILLFSRSGGRTYVVMQGAANLTEAIVDRQWTDMMTIGGQLQVYSFYVKRFNEMWADRLASPQYQQMSYGQTAHYMLPFRGGIARTQAFLPLQRLNMTRCGGVGAGAGYAGRTVIRIGIASLRNSVGLAIAKRLKYLYNAGCNVKLIYAVMGTDSYKVLRSTSGRGAVPMRHIVSDPNHDGLFDKYLHTKFLMLSGYVGSNRSENMVLMGSPNWSSLSEISDENGAVIRWPGVVKQYWKFVDNWYAHPPANNRLPANFRVPAGFDPYAKIRHELEED